MRATGDPDAKSEAAQAHFISMVIGCKMPLRGKQSLRLGFSFLAGRVCFGKVAVTQDQLGFITSFPQQDLRRFLSSIP